MNMPPWSFSSLTSFETCPKRYAHIKVYRDVVDVSGEEANWGKIVHKHLEDRIAHGTCLPVSLEPYEKLVAPIVKSTGTTILAEQQLAVDNRLQPVKWDDPAAWCRGIVDLGVLSPNKSKAVLLDWKTGKRKTDTDQLKLFAGLAFSHYASINVVRTGFVWLKEGKTDIETFERKDVPVIWQGFDPRVKRMERAYVDNKFPPKPSGLCRKHCPVPKSKCEFSGRS